jgi:hypothetical protein
MVFLHNIREMYVGQEAMDAGDAELDDGDKSAPIESSHPLEKCNRPEER